MQFSFPGGQNDLPITLPIRTLSAREKSDSIGIERHKQAFADVIRCNRTSTSAKETINSFMMKACNRKMLEKLQVKLLWCPKCSLACPIYTSASRCHGPYFGSLFVLLRASSSVDIKIEIREQFSASSA